MAIKNSDFNIDVIVGEDRVWRRQFIKSSDRQCRRSGSWFSPAQRGVSLSCIRRADILRGYKQRHPHPPSGCRLANKPLRNVKRNDEAQRFSAKGCVSSRPV